jgi:hypothetical protein
MASHIESGMSTYVAHFQLLIDVVMSFGEKYQPFNERLAIPELERVLDKARESIEEVDRLVPLALSAESKRHDAFAGLPALATRVGATAKVSDIDTMALTRIEEVIRKIHGARHHQIKPDDEGNHVSVSQVSFSEQVEHLKQLTDIVDEQENYRPMEEDITPGALRKYALVLADLNNHALATVPPLAAARLARNEILYAPKTGMMDTAHMVKEYVKAVFGAGSPQFKEINHITFKTKKV